MSTSAVCKAFKSGVMSPVSSRIDFFKGPFYKRARQSAIRSLARAFRGAIKMTLLFGECLKTRNIASSDIIVFPEPVGAPINTFESVWYRVWNTCVYTGLKNLNLPS